MYCEVIVLVYYTMKGLIFILTLLVLVSGCDTGITQTEPTPEPEKPVECSFDSDCGTGGCSGQICGHKDNVGGIMTTCEFREDEIDGRYKKLDNNNTP